MRKESAKQLLARLAQRPDISKLDVDILDNLQSGSVVELNGATANGKSTLLHHWLITCITPLHLNGLNASVIYVDNDCKFNVSHFTAILRCRLEHCSQLQDCELDNVIKNSLSNLYIVTCDSCDEFLVTLLSFEKLLESNENISAIVIDSFCAFYWINNMNCMLNLTLLDQYHKKVITLIANLIKQFKISVFVTNRMQPLTKHCDKLLHSTICFSKQPTDGDATVVQLKTTAANGCPVIKYMKIKQKGVDFCDQI